ncbi:MAG: hypothetical protein LBR97_02795 [Dysgonamonadaceae bacterium]|jgi:hypothetical protein|nr:hypothetical protein [Dysgonamonadaceae bacterium]
MKKILWILLFVSTTCCGQNKDFDDYISKFKEVTVPFEINQANFQEQFPGNVWNDPYMIDEKYVRKFVYCNDPAPAHRFMMADYGYGYGIKWETEDYHIVILRMQRDQGDDPFNFDRLDLMLVVYDKLGRYIDRKIISHDNEMWFSHVRVNTQESIFVRQAMMNLKSTELIDINKVYTAMIQDISYEILEYGTIDEIFIDDLTGQLIWNKENNKFSLESKDTVIDTLRSNF